jgi:hypothetical protein
MLLMKGAGRASVYGLFVGRVPAIRHPQVLAEDQALNCLCRSHPVPQQGAAAGLPPAWAGGRSKRSAKAARGEEGLDTPSQAGRESGEALLDGEEERRAEGRDAWGDLLRGAREAVHEKPHDKGYRIICGPDGRAATPARGGAGEDSYGTPPPFPLGEHRNATRDPLETGQAQPPPEFREAQRRFTAKPRD